MNGAMVSMSGDSTADYSSSTFIPWDAEVYDVGGWHDNVTNNTRLTTPSSVDYVIVNANVQMDALAGGQDPLLSLTKNGSSAFSGNCSFASYNISGLQKKPTSVATPPIPVVAGDYFQVFVDSDTDTSSTLKADQSSFAIRAFDLTSGAQVKKASDQTTANYTSLTAMAFDSEVYDVGSWHDNSTDNSRLTVPSGVDYACFHGCVQWNLGASAESATVYIRKNGTDTIAGQRLRGGYSGNIGLWVATPPILVTPGDYFELMFQYTSDTSITVFAARTAFAGWKIA
jgi:hypothetical protein